MVESGTSGFKSITDFSATLQEIDEAIHDNGGFRNSNEGNKMVNVGSDTKLVVMEMDFTSQREKQYEEDGPQEVGLKSKGTWTRMTRSKIESEKDVLEKKGPKRKLSSELVEVQILEQVKKHKLDDETKNFSTLLASEFGMAEVAGQPCQIQ
ncbi:hypothetical protein SO802_025722 [Lithocarpus litseifolius]|uniref:Uncharacterized protein n=1 Tax=Lithocarpus litseifolius TaxID=425828 RepID=A0AAW2C039_9ROSI